ncbi:TrbC/VirB2 family protein [uncultured Cetobacterium sp.]|uniref:TrbC/VirB2 family protein n=1 Tax=uncultured Cetobacterium sp. TaxID=527638 RepID=UPI0026228D4E|nr:TrbC/VirB2 family protein [uncultured Cetobacterium sp.]
MKKILFSLLKNYYVGIFLFGFLFLSQNGFASATSMPWEGPLDKILKSMTGPVAKAVGVLAIVAVGGAMAFGEMGSAMKKLLSIVLGLSIIFAASTWGLTFFGFAGSVQM